MTRIKKRKNGKQTRIIIAVFMCFFCVIAVSYAAFATTLTINSKGNYIKILTVEDLKLLTTNVGDGLYESEYEDDKYFYRGADPDNYIKLDNRMWRIMSIEPDNTLRVISTTHGGITYWDDSNGEERTNSTYCTNTWCNAWAATSNMLNNPSAFTVYFPDNNPATATRTDSGTVERDSTINTYVNTTVYNGYSSKIKDLLIDGKFYIGSPGNLQDTESLETNIEQIKTFAWEGKIGIMNILEYIQTSTDENCETLNDAYQDNCSTNNWMNFRLNQWTISPIPHTYSTVVWYIKGNGQASSDGVGDRMFEMPVSHLASTTRLRGKGTYSNPYQIFDRTLNQS